MSRELARFGRVPEALLYNAGASDAACRLYAALTRHANGTGEAWPARKTLREEIGWKHIVKVDRVMSELVRLGAVEKVRRGRRQTNVYRLLMEATCRRTSDDSPDSRVRTGDESGVRASDDSHSRMGADSIRTKPVERSQGTKPQDSDSRERPPDVWLAVLPEDQATLLAPADPLLQRLLVAWNRNRGRMKAMFGRTLPPYVLEAYEEFCDRYDPLSDDDTVDRFTQVVRAYAASDDAALRTNSFASTLRRHPNWDWDLDEAIS